MGGITRRTLLETQDIKESQVTGGKVLDHTLGSQELGTSAAIIVEGTQIKADLITEHHVLDHTLGSHNLGTTVAIIVEGTQVKADVISAIHILDHSLGSQHLGTTVAIIVEGTQIKADLIGSEHIEAAGISYADQIKDDIITSAKILDHTLGSQDLGTTVAIIVEGTQIKADLIGSEHIEAAGISYADQIKDDIITSAKILDHTLGSQDLGTTVAIIVEGTQVKDSIITKEKFYETLDYGTLAGVGKTGTYLHFGTAFSSSPALVLTGVLGGPGTVAELMTTPQAGSARIRMTGSGSVVVEYIAWGPKA